jgi:hypothetical protein
MMNEHDPIRLKPACVHLRHKMMYCDARQSTPGMVDDSSDTRVFFCTKTFDALGPDDDPVSTTDCTASRACYCASPLHATANQSQA